MICLSSPIPKPCFVAAARARVTASAAARPAGTAWPAAAAATKYELLSVSETAGPKEIRAAYRREARRWHPDTCREADDKGYFAEQFMLAREAYEVLSDPDLRRDYDIALLRPVDGWAAAVGGGVAFRKGSTRGRQGFGDWESQLEGLSRRRGGEREESWGSRMRRAQDF